jgi:hypothetical protein
MQARAARRLRGRSKLSFGAPGRRLRAAIARPATPAGAGYFVSAMLLIRSV